MQRYRNPRQEKQVTHVRTREPELRRGPVRTTSASTCSAVGADRRLRCPTGQPFSLLYPSYTPRVNPILQQTSSEISGICNATRLNSHRVSSLLTTYNHGSHPGSYIPRRGVDISRNHNTVVPAIHPHPHPLPSRPYRHPRTDFHTHCPRYGRADSHPTPTRLITISSPRPYEHRGD